MVMASTLIHTFTIHTVTNSLNFPHTISLNVRHLPIIRTNDSFTHHQDRFGRQQDENLTAAAPPPTTTASTVAAKATAKSTAEERKQKKKYAKTPNIEWHQRFGSTYKYILCNIE